MAEKVTFSVSVLTKTEARTKFVVKNAIRSIEKHSTWFDLFDYSTDRLSDDELPSDTWDKFEKIATIGVSSTVDGEQFYPDPYEKISVLRDFDDSLRYATIHIKLASDHENEHETAANQGAEKNIFTMMMQNRNATKDPETIDTNKPQFNAKDRLYNDVVKEMREAGCKFPLSYPTDMVQKSVHVIVDTLWYLDGNKHKFDKPGTDVGVKGLPERFAEKFNGYNDYKGKKKAKPQLTSPGLKHHSSLIFTLLGRVFTKSWEQFAKDLEELASSLDSYAEYLEHSNQMQKLRQSLPHPVRQISDSVVVEFKPACNGPIQEKYSILDRALVESGENEAVYFDETIHVNKVFKRRQDRYKFIAELSLSVPVDCLRFDPGAGLGQTIFLSRVSSDRSPVELMSSAAKMAKKLEHKLPEYHTREMKRNFSKTYSNIAGTVIPPHILRAIYTDLTLDASSSPNPSIDFRLRQAILSEDPDLVVDLRHLNKGRPDDTFNVFFDKLEGMVEEITAADERRHNVEHFSHFISVRDLIDQTAKQCPDGSAIPSESTVLFAFVPKNSFARTAKLYKGRINLQHKIQTRQLRVSHIDEHYCAAIFSYLKQYAVKYKEETTFICLDDKSKIDFGEPGMHMSSGVHGKKSVVPVSVALSALDHDVHQKGSLTPSVCLKVKIPDDPKVSFYSGQVFVSLKDSVFQPSTPFRHAREVSNIFGDHLDTPVLLIYSDGGPDHRLTYAAVKLSLIVLFKHLNLDLLIAARTAPGHSWANPVERMMSLLNLAYQNVSLCRQEMSSQYEQELKKCSSMSEIRKRAEKVEGLKEAWIDSLAPMIAMLSGRTVRVQLKGENLECKGPASADSVKAFEEQVKQVVDPEIICGKYTANDLKKLDGYQDFMKSHCIENTYLFQIRKCGVHTCCQPLRSSSGVPPPILPDPMLNTNDREHYLPFDELLGKDTNEGHMPSKTNMSVSKVAQEQQGCPNTVLVGQNVRSTVECYECSKPRCIYSKRALSSREDRALKRLIEKYQYSCGSIITPDGDPLQGIVFVRLQLSCASPVEFPYYASTHSHCRRDVCCHCGITGAEQDKELVKAFRTVLPVCSNCIAAGKQPLKRLPIK